MLTRRTAASRARPTVGLPPVSITAMQRVPVTKPALATVSVLAVVASWNSFMLPLVIFSDPTWWTLPLGVTQFRGQYAADTARTLAYVVVAMVPALALYALAQRQLISGLTSGATKG